MISNSAKLQDLTPRKAAWLLARGRVGIQKCIRANKSTDAFGNVVGSALGQAIGGALRPQQNNVNGLPDGPLIAQTSNIGFPTALDQSYLNSPSSFRKDLLNSTIPSILSDTYFNSYENPPAATSSDRLILSNGGGGDPDVSPNTSAYQDSKPDSYRANIDAANSLFVNIGSANGANLAPTIANAGRLGLYIGDGTTARYFTPPENLNLFSNLSSGIAGPFSITVAGASPLLLATQAVPADQTSIIENAQRLQTKQSYDEKVLSNSFDLGTEVSTAFNSEGPLSTRLQRTFDAINYTRPDALEYRASLMRPSSFQAGTFDNMLAGPIPAIAAGLAREFGGSEETIYGVSQVGVAFDGLATARTSVKSQLGFTGAVGTSSLGARVTPKPGSIPYSFAETNLNGLYSPRGAAYTYTNSFPTYRLQNTTSLNKFRLPAEGDYDFIGPVFRSGSGPQFANNSKLFAHVDKHGREFRTSDPNEYLQIGRGIIENGQRVSYLYGPTGEVRDGYVSFIRNKAKGGGEALFGFVGTNLSGDITTIHTKPRTELFKLLGDDYQKDLKAFRTDTIGSNPQNGYRYPYSN